MNRERLERDSDGNITKMYRYNAKGELTYTHVSDWEDGRIIRKTSYDSNGNMTASFPYVYDDRGNNTEGTWFVFNKGVLMKAEFVYDDKDQMIERIHFGTESIATNKTFQTFDEKGRLAISKYYEAWPDCAPVYTYYEYDDTGFTLKSTTEDENHHILHYEVLTPNEFNKVAEYTSYDGDGKPVYTYRYYYDEDGNKIKAERYDGEGNLVSTEN